MILSFDEVKINDYIYWQSANDDNYYIIGLVTNINSDMGNNYILGDILESNLNVLGVKELHFETDQSQFFTKRSDIDKILIFK